MAERGQALIEFALVTPIMLTILLAVVGVFYLDLSHRKMQNGVDVLAQLAATDPGWRSKVADEDTRAKCNGGQPEATYPDGNQAPGSRVHLTWNCRLQTRWLFDMTPITVTSEAVIR